MLSGGRESVAYRRGTRQSFSRRHASARADASGNSALGWKSGVLTAQRLPITPQVLRALYNIWNRTPGAYLSKLLWGRAAPVSMVFYGRVSSLSILRQPSTLSRTSRPATSLLIRRRPRRLWSSASSSRRQTLSVRGRRCCSGARFAGYARWRP